MSPSRLFILRPIATSLLMVGLLIAGAHRTTFEAVASPEELRQCTTDPRELADLDDDL